MIRRSTAMPFTAVTFFLLLGLAVGIRAQNAGPEQEIRSAYNRYFDALRHKDLPAAMELLDPSFTSRLPDGTVLDFAGQTENLRELIVYAGTIGDATIDIEQLQAEPAGVTVTVKCVLFYSAAPTAKPDSFADDRIRDTWTNTSKGWKLKRSVYLRNTINGNLTGPDPPFDSPQLGALAKEWNAGNKMALDAFWKNIEGKAPLIEDIDGDKEKVLVTFLWRGDSQTKKVLLQGGLPADGDRTLSRLADSDLWYLTERMPKDSRGSYSFQFDGTLSAPKAQRFTATMSDPLNPRLSPSGSFFELPSAPAQPYTAEQPDTPKGNLTRLKIKSAILNEERDYGVYTPAGFDPKGRPYGLLVLFDGEDSGNGVDNAIPSPVILDNLIAKQKIPPLVLLLVNFVSQPWRSRDLTCSRPFNDFLAKELLGEVRRNYNISTDPARIIVGGKSFGGLAAACAGLMHPEAFGNILSMSGSYWYVPEWQKGTLYLSGTGWVIQEYAKRPKLRLRFYMEVGRFESAANQLATNRHLRDVLQLKGYPVTYSEFDGGHDSLCWRGSLANGLIALSGTK
jgi:enterochelin esterase-like enzyme